MANFHACDGAMLPAGRSQCVFTDASFERICRNPHSNHPRCIKHGNLITSYISATSVEQARKIARQRAKDWEARS